MQKVSYSYIHLINLITQKISHNQYSSTLMQYKCLKIFEANGIRRDIFQDILRCPIREIRENLDLLRFRFE